MASRNRYIQASYENTQRETVEQSVAAQRTAVAITWDHLERAVWRQFHDPVSQALRELLNDHATAYVFWQSDGWRPRYPDDEADVRLAMEVQDDEGRYTGQLLYETRLPRRATTAMKRLAGVSRGQFSPVAMSIDIPVPMLKMQPTLLQ